MGVSPLQLNAGLGWPALAAGLPPISALGRMQGLVPETGRLEDLALLAGKVWCGQSQASFGVEFERMPAAELQEFVSDPTYWWDHKPMQSYLKDRMSMAALWQHNRQEPAWLDSQLASWDAEMKKSSESYSSSAQGHGAFAMYEGHLEVGMCNKLCEAGRITDAVDALDLLVERGCYVHNNLFYRVLKRCIANKDLVLGRRIHALTIKSGYEGDAFLATHLIALYASHWRLADAMQVFSKVSTPTAHNWATIIFAYARHGEAAQAIRLYRQMRDSGVIPDNRVYVAVLKACATAGDIVAGKEVHAHVFASPGKPDIFVQNGLLDMYAKCRSLDEARKVFDRLPDKDVVTWNAMISGYAQQGLGQQALDLYSSMQHEDLTAPNAVTFVCLLQACASIGVEALPQGKHLHAQIEERGLQDDVVLGGSLVNMYAKCGSLEGARSVFDRLPDRNMVTWNAMLAGYAQQGMGHKALRLYNYMQGEGLSSPNSVTFICVLQACASVGVEALHQGQQLHAQIEERGLQDDVVLGGSLVNMYGKCGSLEDARRVFDRLPDRNMVTWNAMLAGYAQQGMGQEALILYNQMQQEGIYHPSSVTFVCLLQACASVGVEALSEGKQLHAQIKERGLQDDVVLGGSLVNMYAKCGTLEEARSVFDTLPDMNVVTWTSMIAAYAEVGMDQEALSLYKSMLEEGLSPPDSVTFVCLLHACASVGVRALHEGKQLHAQIKERGLQNDAVLGCSLVNMYAKCGSTEDARRVFDTIPGRDVVTWTAMIAGYAEQGMGEEALSLYNRMQEQGITPPNAVTFGCLLQACAVVGVKAMHQGKQLHAQIEERGLQDDVVLGGSLVNMYAKCGSTEEARRVFDRLPDRSIVTWNVMIAGYAQQGMGQEAISLYSSMQQEGLCSPNSVTFVCLLQACAVVAGLPLGKELHAQIEELGMQTDVVVGGALVNMYAKCGCMSESQQVFDSLPERTIEAWGALIGGYTRQGDSEAVFALLDRMRVEGVQPDGITFLSVLTACSHGGRVDKGRKYFDVMRTEYGITPTVDHYTCMMDLLGRAGHLDEALQMAKTMPFQPNGAVWHTLLSACQKWNNVVIGQEAFELAVSLDGQDAALYVLMSNIYARAEMWEEAKEMQARRVKCGAWKKPGHCWWTDMGGVVHAFVAGDKNHLESEDIGTSSAAWQEQQLVPKMET